MDSGHLHYEASHGLFEVLSLNGGAPVSDGEAGTIVITPFSPYRDTSILLRYDTQDVVGKLTGPLTCNLRNLAASTNILGKRYFAVQHDQGWTFQRNVMEALEAVDDVRLPARYGFWRTSGGIAVEVVVRDEAPGVRHRILRSLEDHGVPVEELHTVDAQDCLRNPIPLRCDLRETSFSASAKMPVSGKGPWRAGGELATVGGD